MKLLNDKDSLTFFEKRESFALPVLLLLGLVFLVFARSLGFTYVWQDNLILPAVAERLAAGNLWQVWFEPYVEVLRERGIYYAPVYLFSFLPDIWAGLDPAFSHSLNLLLHLLNAFLGYLLLNRLSGKCWSAALAVAIWAVHPLVVEPVSWIAARDVLLAQTFTLAGLLALWNCCTKEWPGTYLVASVALLAALATREASLALCLIFPIFIWLQWERGASARLIYSLPYFVLGAIYLLLFIFIFSQAGGDQWGDLRLAYFSPSCLLRFVAEGVGRLLMPWRLAADYPELLSACAGRGVFSQILSAFPFFLLLLGWLVLLDVKSWYALGIAAFILPLLPVFMLQSRLDVIGDRYFYEASFGLTICLALALAKVEDLFGQSVSIIFAAPLALVLAWVSFGHAGMWQSEETLYSRMVGDNPGSLVGNRGLATAYMKQDKLAEAEKYWQAVLKARPGDSAAILGLALLEEKRGNKEALIAYLDSGLEQDSQSAKFYRRCAELYFGAGEDKKALGCIELYRQTEHEDLDLLRLKIKALMRMKRYAEVELALHQALELAPRDVDLLFTKLEVYQKTKRYEDALASLDIIEPMAPPYVVVNKRAELHYFAGRIMRSLRLFRQAIKDYPDHPEIRDNFYRLFKIGKYAPPKRAVPVEPTPAETSNPETTE